MWGVCGFWGVGVPSWRVYLYCRQELYYKCTCNTVPHMADTSVFSIRILATDLEWLKNFVALYPGDTLNAMMTRFIRTRIEALCADPEIETPAFTPDISSADIFAGVPQPKEEKQ